MRFSRTHELNENAFEYFSFASEITRKECIVVRGVCMELDATYPKFNEEFNNQIAGIKPFSGYP